jgi:hypothetical protein
MPVLTQRLYGRGWLPSTASLLASPHLTVLLAPAMNIREVATNFCPGVKHRHAMTREQIGQHSLRTSPPAHMPVLTQRLYGRGWLPSTASLGPAPSSGLIGTSHEHP